MTTILCPVCDSYSHWRVSCGAYAVPTRTSTLPTAILPAPGAETFTGSTLADAAADKADIPVYVLDKDGKPVPAEYLSYVYSADGSKLIGIVLQATR